jgi:hypothetical protein
MSKIFDGRYSAQTDKPLVLFIIGMRINQLWNLPKWLPVATAMPRMLGELARRPDSGFLGVRTYHSGRIVMNIQYWRSFDELLAYAHNKTSEHFPAWAAFNRNVGGNGSVGIWHETYLVEPGKFECIYANMPLFGLAAATKHVQAEGRLAGAKERMTTQ